MLIFSPMSWNSTSRRIQTENDKKTFNRKPSPCESIMNGHCRTSKVYLSVDRMIIPKYLAKHPAPKKGKKPAYRYHYIRTDVNLFRFRNDRIE